MTFPTRSELFQVGVGVAVQRGQLRPPKERLTRKAAETPGTDINIVMASASFMADNVAAASSARMEALYLLSAKAADLDRLVKDRFSPDVVRKQASSAVVTLSFRRVGGSLPAGSYDIGKRLRTTDGVQFEMLETVAFPGASTGPFTGQAQAMQPGLAGDVGIGTVTSFVDAPFDLNIMVTNEEVAAGGADAESDASLRSRAADFFVTARRGTGPAIEFGAKTVIGVRNASVFEELDENGDPTGRIFLYIADALGQANVALAAAVKQRLREYRACGVPVNVYAAVPYYQDVTWKLGFLTGFDPSAAFAQVQLATVFAVNNLKPRETLERSLLFAAARKVPGVVVSDTSLVVPAGDVVPTGQQIIRTSVARVTNT